MRITGGQSRGRVLLGPKGRLIRPTADRVREAVFNILGQDLSGYHVLDLFSGTGSLGLEALSRGAVYSVFVDNLDESVELIKKNVERCGHRHSSRILKRDLTRGLPLGHVFLNRKFDLVFLDPPYSKDIAPILVAEISAGERLSLSARVVVETGKTTDLPSSFSGLSRVHARVYGDTKISIYELRDSGIEGLRS
ncbi:MAG: 16S rRNA (guanine(966)-N(2))-methyltransferase RsmD [Deltaproteobacteria bacterium]|nr:16S rRNA (guanine(966)-N(2))-methyltransferase RsmD [Deltaproteobacteria bacterium]